MAVPKKSRKMKFPLALLFVIFLIINGVLIVIFGPYSRPVIELHLSPGVRLLLFLIGAGACWSIGRLLYRFLFIREVAVEDSVNVAWTFFFYLLLTMAVFSFLDVLAWFWFPLLFLVLVSLSLFTLWGFLGGALTVGSFVTAAAVIIGVWFWYRIL